MAVQDYSTTAASNNAAPPNGAPEGMTPGSVNDTIRQIMADVVTESQVNRVKYLNSVAGTNTITASMTPSLVAYSAGMIAVLTPANTNSGATTLNINSLGALDVFKQDGDALASGDLVAGTPAVLVLDSGADDWILLNPMTLDTLNVATTLTYGGIEVGYRGMPQAIKLANYTLVPADRGTILINASGVNTFTITNSVFTAGDVITIVNFSPSSLTLSGSIGFLYWFNGSGALSTGTRTLACGAATTLFFQHPTVAYIWGTGIT